MGDKYLVKAADGSDPAWPYFVLGADDPSAVAGLIAYAAAAQRLGVHPDGVAMVEAKIKEFDAWRNANVERPSAPQQPETRVD